MIKNYYSKKKYTFFLILITFFLYQIIYSQDVNIAGSEEHYKNGKAMLENGNIVKAINEFEESIKLNPDNKLSHFELGRIYLEKTKAKYYEKAPEHFKKVLSLVHDSSTPFFIDSFYYLGVSFAQLGEYDKTISTFKELLRFKLENPQKNKALNYIGIAYYHKKDYKEAFFYLKKSIENNPDDKLANYNLVKLNKCLMHYNLGDNYLSLKEYDKAIAEYMEAIRQNENFSPAYVKLGECYVNNKKNEKALEEYIKASKLDKTDGQIPYKIGKIYFEMKNYRKAHEYYKKACELDSDNNDFKESLQSIKLLDSTL